MRSQMQRVRYTLVHFKKAVYCKLLFYLCWCIVHILQYDLIFCVFLFLLYKDRYIKILNCSELILIKDITKY